ncbi:uncharacterized protein LOC132591986 [Zootoca vivipara]|uniref:uncharacterized protein LOC132591986 n=1 Tax=Zootoca vivipara TaxID=8524 RepID=UPI00293BB27D|nr:uncharacterized protein LOC132591696 isoform X2 [Zootoca vivipara]XP_060129515.1 uncharacterized protein LOC132591986 [Zootoca vivipara]
MAAHPSTSGKSKRVIKGASQKLRSPASQAAGRVEAFIASIAGDPQALAQLGSGLDALLQNPASHPAASTSAGLPLEAGREAATTAMPPDRQGPDPLSAPSTSAGVSLDPGQATVAASQPLSPMATILELPETTTSGPADSSDDDFVGPSGVLMPNASSTPMVVPAPPPVKRRSEGKQPRRTRRARQAKGRVSGQGQGGRTGASSNVVVSPVAPSQTLAVASRREGLSSASGEEALPVPARASSGGKRRHKSRSRRRAKRRKDDTSASTTSGLADVHIWMVGHSIVHWAGLRAGQTPLGPRLGLPSNIQVTWMGKRGMRWGELLPLLRRKALLLGCPSALVIQLGENDIPAVDPLSLRLAILRDLLEIRTWFPDTVVFWSQMLQRMQWRGDIPPLAGERARKRVNSAASKRVYEIGGSLIRHPVINVRAPLLYRDDGVHLSPDGYDIWLRDVSEGLKSWLGL